MEVEKRRVVRGGKNIIFRGGGGNKYRFRTEIHIDPWSHMNRGSWPLAVYATLARENGLPRID
jgi:hypothetical protein